MTLRLQGNLSRAKQSISKHLAGNCASRGSSAEVREVETGNATLSVPPPKP
eukprot:CAMPEP_0197536010 /NCGR_PEP_ID=MMETSP1318-20131121/52582_1 /TAXON_ID=552666 /ORGANISM="Partenskyella glossopodia, Strain RCC365" /LENGTH=50 /DNA_ID=CAMNT_0043093775 /DNA_START=94 /DNA_END=243 /DNA_ORIENTATION=-